MDSSTFVKRVAELSGVGKEIAERVERVDGLLTGTRLDDLLDCASLRHHGRRALERTALQPGRAQLTGRAGAGCLKSAPLQEVAGWALHPRQWFRI